MPPILLNNSLLLLKNIPKVENDKPKIKNTLEIPNIKNKVLNSTFFLSNVIVPSLFTFLPLPAK